MKRALAETDRRRRIQLEHNKKNNITPQTIIKPVKDKEVEIKDIKHIPKGDIPNLLIELDIEMKKAADDLDFEKAIAVRDRIKKLKDKLKISSMPED